MPPTGGSQNDVPLGWLSASRDHKGALQEFVCATPSKWVYDGMRNRTHPAPHEILVQSHLRGLKVPRPADEGLLLGFDQDGLAAASHFGLDEEGRHFVVRAIASATRVRATGMAAKALDITLNSMRVSRDVMQIDAVGLAEIDPLNEPSRQLFRSRGFEYLRQDEGYEVWVHDLELG